MRRLFRSVLALCVLSLLVVLPAMAVQTDPTEVYSAVEEYYFSFIQEDLDAYLGTQFLAHLSPEELAAKKALVQELWSSFDSSFALPDREECSIVVEQGVALMEYPLSAQIYEEGGAEPVRSYELRMTAMLFATPAGWKVFNVVPSAVFDVNAVADLLPRDVGEDDEEGDTPQELRDSGELAAEAVGDSREGDPSCADGQCAKYPTRAPTAPVCEIDVSAFARKEGYPLDFPGASAIIGEGKTVELVIDEGADVFFYAVRDGRAVPIPARSKVDFTVTTDSCTLQRLSEGVSPMEEYRAGSIRVTGHSFTAKLRSGIAKLALKIVSLFTRRPPFSRWVEAEQGVLKDAGAYSFIGATSRGPGELYLGTGGASAEYLVESDADREVFLFIRTSDDGLHPDGSRNAEFIVNDQKLVFEHHAHEGSVWEWVGLGKVRLHEGTNRIVVRKPSQTSAAFILDKFVLTEDADFAS